MPVKPRLCIEYANSIDMDYTVLSRPIRTDGTQIEFKVAEVDAYLNGEGSLVEICVKRNLHRHGVARMESEVKWT